LLILACLFFFSSRRRHTRFSRDWSSDVCSSDLYAMGHISGGHFNPAVTVGVLVARRIEPLEALVYVVCQVVGAIAGAAIIVAIRSEEHTSELQSRENLVCRLLLEKKK